MAKQPESDSFMDMFGKFGRDLKVPNVDVEAILDHHRKNLEALEKSARAGAAGASSLLSRQREMLQDTLREVAGDGAELPGAGQSAGPGGQAGGVRQEILRDGAQECRRSG